jgi:signal transduction histidine kinase
VVEVVDTGPGMPPEELARAFEFGFRGELATQLRVPGLGAGLWICRQLAGRNGGRLELASEPGAGVRATLTLPAARESQG